MAYERAKSTYSSSSADRMHQIRINNQAFVSEKWRNKVEFTKKGTILWWQMYEPQTIYEWALKSKESCRNNCWCCMWYAAIECDVGWRMSVQEQWRNHEWPNCIWNKNQFNKRGKNALKLKWKHFILTATGNRWTAENNILSIRTGRVQKNISGYCLVVYCL